MRNKRFRESNFLTVRAITAIFSFMLPEDDAKNVVYVNSNVEQLELGRNFRDFRQKIESVKYRAISQLII